mmetsp:Transcript_13911/g.20630  ORF Transcript_13911/g.20630 Transcript_13911/m.20630 type:complete len:123 (+) Transcript_13911:212-580(+)
MISQNHHVILIIVSTSIDPSIYDDGDSSIIFIASRKVLTTTVSPSTTLPSRISRDNGFNKSTKYTLQQPGSVSNVTAYIREDVNSEVTYIQLPSYSDRSPAELQCPIFQFHKSYPYAHAGAG